MRRNLDTEESRRFWLGVSMASYRVDRWPQWMRSGVVGVVEPHYDSKKYPVLESVVSVFYLLEALS